MGEDRITFRRQDTIGANDAEEDHLLPSCFVDTGDIEVLRNCQRSERIVVGRTGAGKTALLRRLAEVEERAIEIRPENLALAYISNSTILTFFEQLGVNLEVFYKLIWRHAFSVEVLKQRFGMVGSDTKASLWEKLKAYFKGERHVKAIQYLEDWGDKFWEEVEIRIKELTTRVERVLQESVKGTIGIDPLSIGGGTQSTATLSDEVKQQVIHRAQKVVNAHHVPQLNEILEIVRDVLDDPQKHYFIVIDRLDENWVDERLRYKLIMALLDTVKDFKKTERVKIVVSLRVDLLSRVFARARPDGFQEEKLKALYLPIDWRREKLIELLDTRLNEVFRNRYSSRAKLGHCDIFKGAKRGEQPVEYILDRTLLRPRDVIAFTNECIRSAEGKATIGMRDVRVAERAYSKARLRSVADEWIVDFPALEECATKILAKGPSRFQLGAMSSEASIQNFCLELCSRTPEPPKDGIYRAAQTLLEGDGSTSTFIRRVCVVFSTTGLVRIKKSARDSFESEVISQDRADGLADDTPVEVHPMFWEALEIVVPQ